jgi:adhesin/invasin
LKLIILKFIILIMINMLIRQLMSYQLSDLMHLMLFISLSFLLTACLGGGGGDGGNDSFNNSVLPEITDERVATVNLLVTDNFQPANGESPTILTVVARDRANQALSDVEVNLDTNSDHAVILTPKGTTEQNGRFSTAVVSSQAETFEMIATAGGVQSEPASITFIDSTIDPRISTVKVLVSNNFQRADGQTQIMITVIARDEKGAPVSSAVVNLFSQSDTAFFEAVSGTTGDNGRFTTTVTNSIAEEIEIIATVGGVEASTQTATFIDSSVDPRVAHVSLLVTDNYRAANGYEEITLTVIAHNAENVPLSEVPVNLKSDSLSVFFDALSGTTGNKGIFTTTVSSRISQTFKVTATAGGQESESVPVTFVAPVGEMVLKASNVLLEVNESTELTLTILRKVDIEEVLEKFSQFFDKVVVEDILLFNDLLDRNVLLPDTPFTVTVNSSNVRLESSEGEITENVLSGRTNENGQAQFSVKSSQPKNVVVTIQSAALTRTFQLFFGANLNLLPQSITALETTTLTALLKDGNHTPLADQEITFHFQGENAETLTPNSAITQHDGTAQVTVTDLENNGGTAIVNVRSGKLEAQATVHFQAAFADNRLLEVKTSASVLNANQEATITAYITDNNGLPIEGQTVKFSAITAAGQESRAQFSPQNAVSNAEGEVKTIVSNSVSENIIVTIEADTAKQTLPLYFGATLRLSTNEAEGISDGLTPLSLIAILSDAQGVGIPGIPVDFRVSGAALLDQFRSHTNELGRTTVNITNDTVSSVQFQAQADNLSKASATLIFQPSAPSRLTLTTPVDSLSLNSETTITAELKDSQGNPVKAGTPVQFTTDIGTITASAVTENGKAEAIFSASTQAGIATITASSGAASHSLTLTIQPGSAGTIEVKKIDPKVIGILGSGVTQSTTIDFLIKDSLGNPVVDGTPVQFSLGQSTLHGGESLSTEGNSGREATGRTNNGLVSVTLKSGTVAGTIDVIGSVQSGSLPISTAARVTLVGGLPDAEHLALAVQFRNIAGGVTLGLLNNITAYVGDRFGNIVPDGTSVSFISEGGTIGQSIGSGAFSTTTELGRATAILQSANPNIPLLGGIPTFQEAGYECSGNYAFVTASDTPLCGNPGLVTVVAFTTGSESFIDKNGNGLYDSGEEFTDIWEPFIDGNDNGLFEEGELYIDVNSNGVFDTGNGQFDGPGGQSENTTIWYSGRVLFSDYTAPIQVIPSSFSIPNGGSQTFRIEKISDIYGNALVKDSKFTVTTNNGKLGGVTDFTFGDITNPAESAIQFTLSSNPCQTEMDGEGKITEKCPLPESATITISITSPFKENSPGGNGDQSRVISGGINQSSEK